VADDAFICSSTKSVSFYQCDTHVYNQVPITPKSLCLVALNNNLRPAISKLFWVQPKCEYSEHLTTLVWVCWTPCNPSLKQHMKINRGILAANCQVRFQCQESTLSTSTHAADKCRQAVVTLKICNSGLYCVSATHVLTIHNPCLCHSPYFWEPLPEAIPFLGY